MPASLRPAVTSVAVQLTLLAGLTACAGSDRVDDGQSGDAVVADGPAVRTFFTRLASQRPARQQQALAMTEPGSPARAYVTFELGLTAARADAEVTVGRARAERSADGYVICAAGRERCSEFTAIEMSGDRISSFAVDGDGIADNVSVGTDRSVALDGGGTVELRSAYLQPSTGNHWVVLTVRAADTPVEPRLGRARYAPADAEPRAPLTTSPVRRVAPGAEATLVLVFGAADVGGAVTLRPLVGGREVQVRVRTAPVAARG